MISATIREDGSCVIILSRCNEFNDHKTPEMEGIDGDICLEVPWCRHVDARHAKILIDRMRERLKLAEAKKGE